MRYKRYKVEMDITGITRKKAAEIIAKVLGNELVYDKENDSYTIENQFNQDWKVEKNPNIIRQRYSGENVVGANFMFDVKIESPILSQSQSDYETIRDLLELLEKNNALTNESTQTIISIDSSGQSTNFQRNLANMLESKKDLLFQALQSNHTSDIDMSLHESEKFIKFPMFNSTLHPEQLKSYIQLSAAMTHQAMVQNNISPKIAGTDNPKFSFILFPD